MAGHEVEAHFMSRTTLCVLTAGILAVLSAGVMIVRYQVLGGEAHVPVGPGTWKVTMLVRGHSDGTARLVTAAPLDFGRQHVLHEAGQSADFFDRPPTARHPERRQVLWSPRPGLQAGPFRVRCEFQCVVDVHRPSSAMERLHSTLYAAPRPGEDLDVHTRSAADSERTSGQARSLTAGLDDPLDQAQALFRFVADQVAREPSTGRPSGSAVECLENGSGDARARARLLVALLRNRGIPARLVAGLALSRGPEQAAHYWAEAWLHGRWLPMCPVYHYFGGVPASYLVFGFGDLEMARSPGNHAHNLGYAFLVEHVPADQPVDRSSLRGVLTALYMLPPPDQKLVEFLLLLPIAALIVCLFRNLIGLSSFGTFAPALVGLCFREVHSLPGLLVFVSIILIGWLLRRALDRYHLLQVPRVAFLLSLVVVVLITMIVAANYQDVQATQYIAIFPMVILTGMIERFWAQETEDGTTSSFRTLLSTMVVAGSIALFLSWRAVSDHMFCYPETLGLIMAVQLLLGRYTGYRLTELLRFRDFLRRPAVPRLS
jgi:7 transmembrane helices usually fused to an inactive transglutaminase/Transglutaminase-like superfamily